MSAQAASHELPNVPEAHDDERYRPLMLAVKAADEAFEKAGDAGTKTWLDDYFLPELVKHGLKIELASSVERRPE